jgi:hypothetical protein
MHSVLVLHVYHIQVSNAQCTRTYSPDCLPLISPDLKAKFTKIVLSVSLCPSFRVVSDDWKIANKFFNEISHQNILLK